MKCSLFLKNFSIKHKYIIFASICCFLTNCLFGLPYYDNMELLKLIDNDIQIELYNHIIFHYIFRFLFIFIFSIFFYRCERKITQNRNETDIAKRNFIEEKSSNSKSILLIYQDTKTELNKNLNISTLNILIVITIMVLQRILEDIFYRSFLRGLDFWTLELPLVTYWNYKYLNFKIYRHHYLALGINLIYCTIYKIKENIFWF